MAQEELGHLDIRLSMDNSDFNKAVKGVTDSVKDVRKDFKLLEAELKNVEKTEEGLSDGLRKLNQVLDTQKGNVKELEKAYERQVEQYGKNSKEARRMGDALRESRIDMERTRTTINRTTGELERLRQATNEAGDSAEGMGDSLGQAGDDGDSLLGKIKGIGAKGGLLAGTALAVLAIAKAFHEAQMEADKASQEITNGLGSVSEQVDITGRDIQKLSEKYDKSADEIVQDTRDVHEQLQGLVDPKMYEGILKDAELVAQVTGTDVKDSLIVVEKMMREFGLTAEESFGFYLLGMENGLNKGDDFVDTIKEYGNEMVLMGLSSEEVMLGLNAGLEAGADNVDRIADSWREFNIRATAQDTGFKDALALLKDESLEQLYQKVLAGEVPMDEFMRVSVEKLKGIDNQRLRNEIGMGLFGDKWLEVGGDAVTASVEMIGQKGGTGLKGVDSKLADVEQSVKDNKNGWQKLGADFKKNVTTPMLDGLDKVWQKLGDVLWRLKETAEKNIQNNLKSGNIGKYTPPFPSGYSKGIRMAVPSMQSFATNSAPSLPDNRPFLHGNKNNEMGTGTVVNLAINAPTELSPTQIAKKTRQTLNQLSLNW